MMPELGDLLKRLEQASREEGIPSIDEEDGKVLMALAYASGARRIADLGAGVGYSTVWLAAGAGARGEAVVYAVEASPKRFRRLSELLGGLRLSSARIEPVNADAVHWLSNLPSDYLGMVFLDIEKESYPTAVRELERVMAPGGVLATHNAIFPTPPSEFFAALEEGPWETPIIVPTWAGLLIAVKKGQH